MFDQKEQTKTKETKEIYIKSAKKRLIKYSKKTGNNIANTKVSAGHLAQYLQEERYNNNYKQPTWRRIRAELKYYFESTHQDKLVTMVDELPRTKIEEPGYKVNSRTNYISLPKKLYQELTGELKNMNTQNSLLAYALLEGIWLTGIRPKEWASMVLVENFQNTTRHMISIENAKNTNDRAFDKRRFLIISNTTDEEMDCLRHIKVAMLNLKKDNANNKDAILKAWIKTLKRVRATIYNTNKKIRPYNEKTITLYSARHQFAADAKASGINEYEIAALMGHASIDTAIRYYGRKRTGDPQKFRVRAQRNQIKKLQTESNIKIAQQRSKAPDWDAIRLRNKEILAQDTSKSDK